MMGDGMTDDGANDSAGGNDTMSDGQSGDTQSTATDDPATGDEAAIIGQFRTLLEDNQITAAELTGEDLAAFGVTACSYAQSAADTTEYEAIRTDVLDGARNDELTIDELQYIIDAAVTVFCPEDAARLGITAGAG